jgi:hypothetical protein
MDLLRLKDAVQVIYHHLPKQIHVRLAYFYVCPSVFIGSGMDGCSMYKVVALEPLSGGV